MRFHSIVLLAVIGAAAVIAGASAAETPLPTLTRYVVGVSGMS